MTFLWWVLLIIKMVMNRTHHSFFLQKTALLLLFAYKFVNITRVINFIKVFFLSLQKYMPQQA